MPCGTPLIAVADGEVVGVDELARGAGPHNLLIRHEQVGVITLYGHLLRPPAFYPGQLVRQGDVIGLSGDPDRTCDSRPHLHLEVRSLDYSMAYNPVDYISANWHTLATVGGYGSLYFQQDMDNPRRWMTLEDQPDTAFGGVRLNTYAAAWPLAFDLRPPANAPLARTLPPLPQNSTWSMRQLGFDRCCWAHWWDPVNPDALYVIDGSPGTRASVSRWSANAGSMDAIVSEAPPAITSPDGRYNIYNNNGYARIVDTTDDSEIRTPLLGATPAINPDNTAITWTTTAGTTIPGQGRPIASVWVADMDGYNARQLITRAGVRGQWLDSNRLLIITRGNSQDTTLSVYDLRDDSETPLGTFINLRNLSVAPGGNHLLFHLLWQEVPETSGIYLLHTQGESPAQMLDWFGAWRWRDSTTLYYLPFDPNTPYHTLASYDIQTGDSHIHITPDDIPFTIMNGDWDVAADGQRIVFQNAADWNMWLLEAETSE